MSNEPDMLASPGPGAADRVNLPGIFLLVVGILNALAGLWAVGTGVRGMLFADKAREEFRKGFEKGLEQGQGKKQLTQQEKEQVEAIGKFMEMAIGAGGPTNLIVGLINLVAAAVTILGAVKMRTLRSRGLAMTGAVLAMLPCISPLGCCLVGEAVGIWALIVLCNAEVRAAFR
jgi:hypothetical protein